MKRVTCRVSFGPLLLLGLLAGAPLRADEADDQFDFATGLLIREEFEMAAEEFDALLKAHPTYARGDIALYRLAEAQSGMHKTDAAISTCRRLLKAFPASDKAPQSTYRLAQLLADTDAPAAADVYAALTTQWPKHALAEAATYWGAEALLASDQLGAAAKRYGELLANFPEGQYAAHARYSRGWIQLREGESEEALAAFDAFLAAYPDHALAPECRLRRGDALQKLKRHAEALKAYESVTNEEPRLWREARLGRAWAMYDAAVPGAGEAFAEAAQVLGDDSRAHMCRFNAANVALSAEDFKLAAERFGHVIAGTPPPELAYDASYWQAYALSRLKAFDRAAQLLAKLGEGKGGQVTPDQVAYLQGEVAFGREAWVDAAAAYGDVTKRWPESPLVPDAAYAQVLALERAEALDDAVAAARQALKTLKEPAATGRLRFALGEYLFRLERYAEADREFAAVAAMPQSGDGTPQLDANYKRAWCAWELAQDQAAREQFGAIAADATASPRIAAVATYMAGRAAERGGDREAAAKQYRQALAQWPEAPSVPDVLLALARLELAGGEHAACEALAMQFLTRFPDDPRRAYAHLYLGEAHVARGAAGEALAAYTAAAKADPALASDVAYGSGWAFRRQNKHAEAAAQFARVSGSLAAEAAFWRARSLEDQNLHEEAATAYLAFRTAHAGHPLAGEAHYREALCWQKAGKSDRSRAAYETLLAAAPLPGFTDRALYDLAWMQQAAGETEAANALFARLVGEFPQSALAGDAQYRLGEAAQEAKNYEQALTHYTAARASAPAIADRVLYKLAWCHQSLNHLEQAATAFAELAATYPESELAAEAAYRAGRALQQAGALERAIEQFEKVGEGSFAERAGFQLGECRRARHQDEQALAAYRHVLEAFPETAFRAQIYLGMGHALSGMGAAKDAIDAYGHVPPLTEGIEAAQALAGIGHAYWALGSPREAARAFLKVDILYGYDDLKPEALGMVVRCWERLGDEDKIEKYRRDYATRYPEQPLPTVKGGTP